LQHYSAALNAPLVTDVLATRISGNRYQRNGYYNGAGGALVNTDARAKFCINQMQTGRGSLCAARTTEASDE